MSDEFEHFRSAFLIRNAEDIYKGLQTVFISSVRLSPTLLSHDVQFGFMSSLRELMEHEEDASVSWGFHGTDPANLQSIYERGLLIPGQGNDVKVVNGQVYGRGIYIASAKAAWLSARFCCSTSGRSRKKLVFTPQMLVCAVLQSSAVRQGGADATVVFNASHVVPLFLAEADQFFREVEHWWMLPLPAPASLTALMEVSSQHQLLLACASAKALIKADASAVTLRWSGCSASELKEVGFSVDALKTAGYEAADVLGAGYEDADLLRGGFSAASLRQAGCAALALQEAGFSATDLMRAGYADHEVMRAGYPIPALKQAGYSASALRQHGYTAAAMKDADERSRQGIWNCCYSVHALRRAGYSAAELKSAGYSVRDLKAAGYKDRDVVRACYEFCCAQCEAQAVAELKRNGYSAAEAQRENYVTSALRKADCHAAAKKGWQDTRWRLSMKTVLWSSSWLAWMSPYITWGLCVFLGLLLISFVNMFCRVAEH